MRNAGGEKSSGSVLIHLLSVADVTPLVNRVLVNATNNQLNSAVMKKTRQSSTHKESNALSKSLFMENQTNVAETTSFLYNWKPFSRNA